jgi:CyaY protein
MMTPLAYEQLTDQLLLAIEEQVETFDAGIESELNGNILTLEFPNRSKIVINKQPAIQEIWVAAKSGGFHLKFSPEQHWHTASGETLAALLSKVCSEQAATALEFTL